MKEFLPSGVVNKSARLGKRLFLDLEVGKLIGVMNPLLMRICFFGELSGWIKKHRNLRYSDGGDREYRIEKRYGLYQFLLEKEGYSEGLDYLEFGVAGGESLKWWIEHNRDPSTRFFGFDTFTGLPERWGVYEEGTFDQRGEVPQISDHRCTYVKGLFQDSLPSFIEHYEQRNQKIIHLDADLYSSTLFVLTSLAPSLNPGDLLIFDEFAVPTHEFRAFSDFVSAYRVRYEVIAAVNTYMQVAIKLT